jgi:hypothetical protein
MALVVYLLCTLTSAACAWLLFRGYRRSAVKLLLWSALCFVGLGLNNVLLFVDMIIVGPELSLALWRKLPAVAGVLILVYGLIFEA